MPALFRRRQVWLPTLWGGLLLLVLGALALLALGFAANGLLALQDPARGKHGHGARTLVVEGWLEEYELAQAIELIRRGQYERVLTTGGPIEMWNESGSWANYALRAAGWLNEHGPVGVPVIALPAPASKQDRTYLSAVMVRDWARRSDIALEAIDLYSAGVHARRSRLLFRMALGSEVEVGVLAAAPKRFDAERWWTSSAGTKLLMSEAVSLAWTACCYWPAAPGSHEERWAVPGALSASSAPK